MIKDIRLFALAHEGDTSALELAEALAARTGARIACTGCVVLPDGFLGYSENLDTEAAAQARKDQSPGLAAFASELKARPRPIAYEQVEAYPKRIEAMVAPRAQRSDAVVVRAPPKSHETAHSALIEAALFAGAAPVFVAPLHWRAREIGTRVLVCWDESREAARAAHQALAFAAPDAHIVVATVAEHPERKEEGAGRQFAAHLARGGMTAEFQMRAMRAEGVAATLDHVAQEVGADLVVLGGYRHARMQEAMFGGVTRTILRAPQLPLLLAH